MKKFISLITILILFSCGVVFAQTLEDFLPDDYNNIENYYSDYNQLYDRQSDLQQGGFCNPMGPTRYTTGLTQYGGYFPAQEPAHTSWTFSNAYLTTNAGDVNYCPLSPGETHVHWDINYKRFFESPYGGLFEDCISMEISQTWINYIPGDANYGKCMQKVAQEHFCCVY